MVMFIVHVLKYCPRDERVEGSPAHLMKYKLSMYLMWYSSTKGALRNIVQSKQGGCRPNPSRTSSAVPAVHVRAASPLYILVYTFIHMCPPYTFARRDPFVRLVYTFIHTVVYS